MRAFPAVLRAWHPALYSSRRGRNGVWFLPVSNATGLRSRTNVAAAVDISWLAFGCCGGGDSCSLMFC
uniref:Uncharacterized protein n=1 Tax=Salix viminalis TaxID=40686 RepID=A0A6N2KBA4_SALVM